WLPESLSFDFSESFGWLMITMPTEVYLSPLANVSIAGLITLIQAMILNRIINNYSILGKPSYLPALMYVSAASILMPFLVLNPVMVCNFLTLWMISKFLSIYHRSSIQSAMFDLGMIVAIGTLIYFPFIAMMPLLWISLIIFRPFDWREWLITILGFATIYFFLAVYYFLNDSMDKFYQIWLPLTNKFPTEFNINPYDYIVLLPLLVIIILSAISLQQNFFRSFVQVRKTFQLLFFMFLLGMLSFYLRPQIELYHFLLGLTPVSIFMAYYFMYARKKWVYETLYLVLAGVIIYFQSV
ncbi:MAG TPA: beta-carotene 15,15'-monooxygenase, partial [Sphingobacteriaceae bacterium]|nr:beta-carotene 15,15'-monooxygenase [Sphingobacteriaceae bacterium]